ncbi:aminotransferase class V-fold PLP-dependent enzyme [Salegentibacter salegens]|uniref:Selenocysteine lyase/Cysteine desulfurase n=1 Tax=Salegentibacter salegens TaxID=143223 RepID=A0A1M7I977_9FLAO|nr:aminotransferase class V-fold PLP-dependent enzyme [Salegentibacter salegens]PRX47993.1 selenocysteine lyase/cysteine desulfurase [Salegentibacter salegens]SHM37123.1 Selenocysteine lyase/Cysteine desulfurase [Salegentibacter salegens]
MENLRKGFPVLEQYTYLNTAASGLLPESVWEFRQNHDLDFLLGASVFKEKQSEILTETRELVGESFGCPPSQIALVPNFSYGFNTLLEGLEKPQKALLLKNDYPSLNWAVESRDFEIEYAEIDESLENKIAEAFKKQQPDFFAFSIVQYINGIKLDLEFLQNLKKEYPETLFIADGTQFCGTEAFDFNASAIDILICSTYKWLNGGYGNAFMLFKKEVEGKIIPKALGFGSLQGKYKAHEGNFIGKFEPGHQDTLNYGSLAEALKLIKKTGIADISSQIKALSAKAKSEFTKMHLLEESVVNRAEHSSIFNIKGNDKLFEYLRSKQIIVSQRGEGIRVSFHYFNTEKELDFLLKELRKFGV